MFSIEAALIFLDKGVFSELHFFIHIPVIISIDSHTMNLIKMRPMNINHERLTEKNIQIYSQRYDQ